MIAQAHLESCFGLTPRARVTNSVFSEGLYDNGKNAVTYKNQDESVYGYVKLLQNDYLVNNKTTDDLLQHKGFVNFDNKRYAKDPKYESKLKNIRNRIIRMFPELAN